MNKSEVMLLFAKGEEKQGTIDDINITIYPENIADNIMCNNGKLDMRWIMDFVEDETGDMVQGYCLQDVDLI